MYFVNPYPLKKLIRPMKTILPGLLHRIFYYTLQNGIIFFLFISLLFQYHANAQCPGGYTSATLNWDNLDYLHSFGSYGTNNPSTGLPYVSAAMRQTQNFAIGTNKLTISTLINVNNAGSVSGDVTTHTGDAGVFTGADIHYVPTAGQNITMTFLNEVQNASFTLNDIDRSAVYTITSSDALSVAQTITVTTYAGTILTVGGTPTARTLTATNSNPNYTVNTGAATITVAGPVKTIVVTVTTVGSNAEFFLSDIAACVADPGFPTNYYSSYTEPFTGQPAYFLANPQNLHVYMVNASTAVADYIFSDPGTNGTKMNSLAYDPVNKWLYYVMDNYPLPDGPPFNKTLKKYDFNTETISTVLADITTLNFPTFVQGVEFAGAAFYNGSLYLGLEGTDGLSYSTNIESFILKIDFDGSGNPTSATQAFAIPGDDGAGNPLHDWGDFVTKDGTIITHATNAFTSNHYIHYTMQTGASVTYSGTAETAGQLGQTWNGNVYRIKNAVALYNNDGTIGAQTTITTTSCSSAWSPNAGDASDPFKPKCDFGDAPATYDPVALSPAVHQKHCNNATLRLGSLWDREWSKNTSADASGDATDEDGITTVTIMVSDGIPYNHVQEVTVLNNTGSAVTLGGWLDYDADGVFETSEGVVVSVPSNAAPQTITLGWTGITVTVGTPNSFLRIRLVGNGNTMTASNPTGWYDDGEVEDYTVISSAAPLTIKLLDFNAYLTQDKNVQLKWKAITHENAGGFEIQRSSDQDSWKNIGWKNKNDLSMNTDYNFIDQQPLQDRSYYRLKMVEKSGSSKFSITKWIWLNGVKKNITIVPNPVSDNTTVSFTGINAGTTKMNIRNLCGQVISSRLITIKPGENHYTVDVSVFAPGIYIVEISTPEKTYTNKMTVY